MEGSLSTKTSWGEGGGRRTCENYETWFDPSHLQSVQIGDRFTLRLGHLVLS